MFAHLKKILFGTTLGLFCIAPLQAVEFSPHIGADYKFWDIKAKKKAPERDYYEIFPDITRTGAVYVGARIAKIWGIDFGYEHAADKELWHSFDRTRYIFGTNSVAGDAVQTKLSLDAWTISGSFYWEVYRCLELVLHAGVASLQPKSTIIYHSAGGPTRELSIKTKSKYSGRFGFGAQYLFARHFGVRALVTFDQTSRLNITGFNQDNAPFDIHPYKNSTSFNVGLFAELCPRC